jgi:hypothetical protein
MPTAAPALVLTVGSTYNFQLTATKDGRVWDLSQASVQLLLTDPAGNVTARAATVTNGPAGLASYNTLPADLLQEGSWRRAWKVLDGGVVLTGRHIPFSVEASPGPTTPGLPPDPSAPAGSYDHALLGHLDYSSSGHTGFVPSSRRVTAGPGLSGGGDLSTDQALSLPDVVTAGAYGDAGHYPVFTLDGKGRVVEVASQPVTAGVSSFNGRGGDVGLLADDVTAALGYTPVPPARTLTAGPGLAGGGDLSADVTLSLPAVGPGAGAYGDATHYPVLTLDDRGRVTAVVPQAVPAAGVSSFNARTGAVVLTAADLDAARVTRVLFLPGGTEQTHINHGFFWPAVQGYDLGDGFLWDAWVRPAAMAGNGYLISDGYGGSHSLLWGFTGVPGSVSGNVWNGSALVSFGGNYTVAGGEWVHLALLWPRANQYVYSFVNGVCDGQAAFAGPRVTPAPGGPGVLYVGGSDHLNLAMSLAALRGYDRGLPLPSTSTFGLAFHPDRRFGVDDSRSNAIGSRQPDFLADYTVPGVTVPDHAPAGCVSGSNYVPAPGTVTATPAAGGTLANATTYFYKVTALNWNGESTPSTEASALTASPNLKINLSWTAVAGADFYNVYRSTTTGAETFLASTTTPSYSDTGAVATTPNPPPVLNTTGYPTRHPGFLEDLNIGPGIGASNNQVGPWNLGRWADPKCSWVSDSACPYGQAVGPATLPAENVPAPATVPALALAFDSFGRRNQTYAFQSAPTLGSTEGGSLGPLAWQTGTGVWGILQGAAVYLGSTASGVAWVNVGTANQDIRVTNRRGGFNNRGCGIAFRVQDATNFWYAFAYGDPTNNIVFYGYQLAGVQTALGSFNPGITWDTLRVLVTGTTVTIYTDAVQGVQLTAQTTLQTATGAGITDGHLAVYVHSLHRNRNWTVFQG